MMVIGRYLLLFISLSGLSLSVGNRFSEEDIDKFLDYIVSLHNGVRYKHDVPSLERSYEMDVLASQQINGVDINSMNDYEKYGINYGYMYYDDNTQLDGEEAMQFFSLWYEQGNFYNYTIEPNYQSEEKEFTQIVWRNTKQIGLAFQYKEYQYIVVVIYKPFGNIFNSYTMNVNFPMSERHAWNPEFNELYYKTEKEKFIDNLSELHNDAREKHRVSKLEIDNEMTKLANMMLMSEHKIETVFGEIWFTHVCTENTKLSDEASAKDVFSWWYDVERYFDYDNGQSSEPSDKFTQIVWKETKYVGIDVRETGYGQYHGLVLYAPRGNIPDQYKWNVLDPRRPKKHQGGSSRNNR